MFRHWQKDKESRQKKKLQNCQFLVKIEKTIKKFVEILHLIINVNGTNFLI